MNLRPLRSPVMFGAADGVVIAMGLIVSLTGQPHALVRAAVGAGVAELVGMTAGQWLSDERAGFAPAFANGGAAFAACLLPALPYLAGNGWEIVTASLAVVAAIGTEISLMRPERGILAPIQTFGVLILAAALCAAASYI